MIPTVNLPKDGAAWSCTFVRDGQECSQVATRGLAFVAYQVALAAVKEAALDGKPQVSFMRALCPEHIAEVSMIAGYGS